MNFRHIIPPTSLASAVLVSMAMAAPAHAQGLRAARTTTAKPITTRLNPVTNDTTTTTAATVPVGFTTVTVTPATDANTPASQVLSVPFYQPAAYAAAVSSVDSSTQFTSSSASWTANQFSQAGAPYLVHFKSGNSVGRYFLITSNTTNQVTVYPRGYDLTTVAAAADTFEVVPAYTLGTLFGTTSVPFQSGSSANSADNILLYEGSAFAQYYYNGSAWRKVGNLNSQNNTILYPDEGIFLVRRGTSSLSLTFLGTVPSTAEKSDVPGPGTTFVANRFPTDTTLAATGLQSLPNWLSGSSANSADNVLVWTGASWGQFYYNGTNWRKAGSLNTFDSQAIPATSAVLVIRKSSATTTASTLTQALPYSL